MIIWTDGDPSACAYPLNATEAQILAFGVDGKLTMSNGEQTGTYAIQGGLASAEIYAASGTTALDYTTGIKATEHVFSLPMITGGAGAVAVTAVASLDENPVTASAPIRVKAIAYDDGTFVAAAFVDNVVVATSPCSATGRFTIIANGATGNVIIKIDGVEMTLTDPIYTTQDVALTCYVEEAAGLSGSYAGQTASITTVTDSRRIVYGSGFTICGQVITP